MKKVSVLQIEESLVVGIGKIAYTLSDTYKSEIKNSHRRENSMARSVFEDIIENFQIAQEGVYPLCQDTGIVVFFVEIGSKVVLDGDLEKAIDNATARASEDYYFRKSVVREPLIKRENSMNNSPGVKYYEFNESDKIKISFMLKGAGSENVSMIKMFNPTVDICEVEDFVVDVVKKAGANPCPPIVVGVGVGGTFDKAAVLSKKALLREIGVRNQDKDYAEIEKRILRKINALNIGPAGFGGKTTAFDVFIEHHPCHIASLPVAVNINCHSIRHSFVEF